MCKEIGSGERRDEPHRILIILAVRLWSLLVMAALLLTILNIDYGCRVEIFMTMTRSYIFNI